MFVVPEVRGNPLAAHAEAIRGELADLRHVLRLDELADLAASADGDAAIELPDVHGPTASRSSTPAARPASRRGRCCATPES